MNNYSYGCYTPAIMILGIVIRLTCCEELLRIDRTKELLKGYSDKVAECSVVLFAPLISLLSQIVLYCE